MKKFTKSDLVEKYAETHSTTKVAAKEAIDNTLEVINAVLEAGREEDVKLSLRGFGTFSAKMTEERTMVSAIADGKTVAVPSRLRATFKKAK